MCYIREYILISLSKNVYGLQPFVCLHYRRGFSFIGVDCNKTRAKNNKTRIKSKRIVLIK
jgi:hypothetical protein